MPACRISPAHLLLVACWMVAISLKDAAAQVSADLALVDGKIWTVNEEQPQAEAAAIWQGRILAVGSTKSIQALIGAETRVIHLNGRRVIPGFHDCHVHLLAGGLQLRRVDLKDAADEAEFGRRLQDCNRRLPPGRWMLGGNWDHDRTFAGKLPTAAMLDVYVPDRPCLLSRYDGHMAVANSKALELAAITAKTEDPSGGEIVRDPASKQPTGILRDTAMRLVADLLPPLADDEIAQAIEAALELARRLGVTSIDDMAGEEAEVRRRLLQCYQQMGREGRLTARIHLRWPLEDWAELADLGVQQGFGGDFVTIGGVKGFIDGSLGSSTAKMWQTYQNEPGSTGLFVMPPDRLGELIRQADAAGLAVAVHAIGDRGNSTLLDLFADVTRTNPPRDRRFRIEHAQHLTPKDFGRFAEGHVIASMQPYHAVDDGRWAEGRIGTERCKSSYAFRSLLDHGARLAFGSDWPVAPLDPLAGIDAAVNRRTIDGEHPNGWFPEQRITAAEAIRAYTRDAAYATFCERRSGSIAPGMQADLAALSRDILAQEERSHISDAKVTLTIVAGQIIYEATP
ncbi:MAG TPA: amidohydrolase [Pirellulales bacterium]|nr:amidohydrolase [Pirellulales bacterium]